MLIDIMFRNFRILAVVPATDIDRARAWYEEKLGLVPIEEPIGRLYYEAPDGSCLLIVPTAFPGANSTAAGWDVTDIDTVIAELRARGVEFIDYDLPGYKTTNGVMVDGGYKMAWFRDSEGNTLGINEYIGD
jgi:catechol 2,3-dioxygenase-like lactoylglutathione lyase family enzyme